MKWRDLSYHLSTWEYLGEDCGLKNAAQAIKDYESLRKLMDPKKKEKKRGRKPKVVLEVRPSLRGRMSLYRALSCPLSSADHKV